MYNSKQIEPQNARLEASLKSRGFRFGVGLATLGLLTDIVGIANGNIELIAAGTVTAFTGIGTAAISGIIAINNHERSNG